MTRLRSRPGYVFLITVLFIGAMGIVTTVSLMLLSWASEQNGDAARQSREALNAAESCLRLAIQQTRDHPSLQYTGSSSFLLLPTTGSCSVLVRGTGNVDRLFCAVGYATGPSGKYTRRIVARMQSLHPPLFTAQKEVSAEPACSSGSASSSATSS